MPEAAYRPSLSPDVVEKGLLSAAQLESVVYAGQAHEQTLPADKNYPQGMRRGYMIGDGTGVGKTRQIAGIMSDSVNKGRKRHVWISKKDGLIEGAKKAWQELGMDPKDFFTFKDVRDGGAPKDRGVIFTTYSMLRSKQGGALNVDKLIAHLGEDFDGVIGLDESHEMGNPGSQQAQALLKLQRALPNARVVYASATGATELKNLHYAERLGLWGAGTDFADEKAFMSAVEKGGVASMEAVAQSLKSMGLYAARSISFNDGTPGGTVGYSRVSHRLDQAQADSYDRAADAWNSVLQRVREEGADVKQFWGTHQRFFEQLMTAMQTPAMIAQMERDLAEGRCPVVQLVNTFGADTDRMAEAVGDDGALEDGLEVGPRNVLRDFISRHLGGDQDLLALADSLDLPESALDQLMNKFGADAVAECTGRRQRFVGGKLQQRGDPKRANRAEAEAFQGGGKKILVFSGAAGTGNDFHASNRAKNQAQRAHYLLQPGPRADAAVQGFGRTHRTDQAVAPVYRLVEIENLQSQKRFVSAIARRLDQLGALTKGQRDAGGGGIFGAGDNLESKQAREALRSLWEDLRSHRVAGIDPDDLSERMSLSDRDRDEGPDMKRFLNRMIALPVAMQNALFGAFSERLDESVEAARASGELSAGVEHFPARSVSTVSDDVVYTDPTGAQVRHVVTRAVVDVDKIGWDKIEKAGDPLHFLTARADGTVWAAYRAPDSENEKGRRVKRLRLVGPAGSRYVNEESLVKHYGEILGAGRGDAKGARAKAEALWRQQYDEAPDTEEREEHFLTGALMPVWARIPGSQPRIYRVRLDGGETLVARHVPRADAEGLAQRLRQAPGRPETAPKGRGRKQPAAPQAAPQDLSGPIDLGGGERYARYVRCAWDAMRRGDRDSARIYMAQARSAGYRD